jgi:hypothetical protein
MTYYLNTKTFAIETEQPKVRHIRLPLPALLVVAPLMGLAFVMFLPTIGILMFGRACFQVIAKGIKALMCCLALS